VSTCLAGICYALYFGTQFAGVCLCYLPVFLLVLSTFGIMVKKSALEKVRVV
jgi:hypothetical protein